MFDHREDEIDEDFDDEEWSEIVVPVSERLVSKSFVSLFTVFAVFELAIFWFTGIFFLVTGSGFLHAVFRAGCLSALAAPVGLLLVFPLRWITIFTAGTIRLEADGHVYVYDTTDEQMVQYAARLEDCRCFFANRTWATHPFRRHLFPSRSGVWLLELPKKCRLPGGSAKPSNDPIILEIGRTEETRRLWIDAFTRVRVYRNTDRERLPSPFSMGWSVLWSIVLGHVIFGLCGVFELGVVFVMRLSGVPIPIVRGINWAMMLPGSVLLVFYTILSRLRRRTRICGIHRLSGGPKAQWNATLQILGIVAANIAFFWTFQDDETWTLESRITATVLAAVIGLLAIGVGRAMYAEPQENIEV